MRPPRPLPRSERDKEPVVLHEPPPPLPQVEPETPSDAVPKGWEGIMQPGERILWRGKPVRRIKWVKLIFTSLFGTFFAGFALFWMIMAAQDGGFAWMFGLIHFSVGAGFVTVAILDERMRLRDTWFTLSDRAAYIARRHWWKGKILDTYPITAEMPIRLGGGDKAGDVIFATKRVKTKNGYSTKNIGFLDIAQAPEVFALMKHAREALQ
ncbi:hypothetical protein SAMN05877809_10989 [Rhodobacter sp. JA431]|uniref:aspartate carbamoyltransferase catalytic subunit n=1 Tax=Rhodobacter sp. JA431 TaxID=570013 RepID=UPI000BDD4F33|nr:aspartate carbamoyltransferase catalytic subunit [Rhodobacter sp. JA431]SOC17434.1 hypothetical protein SAMN05877809_10989 [Rhodobacter sp. JA431]